MTSCKTLSMSAPRNFDLTKNHYNHYKSLKWGRFRGPFGGFRIFSSRCNSFQAFTASVSQRKRLDWALCSNDWHKFLSSAKRTIINLSLFQQQSFQDDCTERESMSAQPLRDNKERSFAFNLPPLAQLAETNHYHSCLFLQCFLFHTLFAFVQQHETAAERKQGEHLRAWWLGRDNNLKVTGTNMHAMIAMWDGWSFSTHNQHQLTFHIPQKCPCCLNFNKATTII